MDYKLLVWPSCNIDLRRVVTSYRWAINSYRRVLHSYDSCNQLHVGYSQLGRVLDISHDRVVTCRYCLEHCHHWLDPCGNLLEPPLNRGNRVCRVPMTVPVPGGSTAANLLEPSPTHLVPPVKMWFGKFRYSRTTPSSCERPLHTLRSLY